VSVTPQPCFLCKMVVDDPARLYCWGCQNIICDGCSVNPGVEGTHLSEEHLVDVEEPLDDYGVNDDDDSRVF
jgi:hypothetical protein